MRYYEDPAPGAGARPTRAWTRSDAPRHSLNGEWAFRLSSRADVPADFVERDFDDSGWDRRAVPSAWWDSEREGPGFPFGIDPPFLPDENPTGDYRCRFSVPDDWPAAVLRFDGVGSCMRVWVNGDYVGGGKGRLPWEFDVGGLLRPGQENVLAVRVHQWSSGSYLEASWQAGLLGDVELLCRPAGAIDDLFVHADYDRVTGAGRLCVDADVPVRVTVPELGVDVPGGEEVWLERVDPWSAEIPRLYDGVVASAGERVAVRIGFRRVTVEDGRLLVNGYRVLVNGVGPGDDVERLKAHNVDAVLVSGCAPDFLERCDELGLYVVYECDVSTRGFAEVGWRRNPIDDPAWEPALVDRLRRTVERDKNHPSVILWSLAGESGTGRNLLAMAAWARARDPSRPLYYAHDASCRDVEVDLLGRGEHLPVRITGSDGTVRIENLQAVRDLSYLSFVWALEDEGVPVAEGTLRVGALPAGAIAEPPLPALPAVRGEAWLTVRAVLAADEPWASAGHEVAWGQVQIAPAPPLSVAPRAGPVARHDGVVVGAGVFDARSGALRRLGDLPLDGPRLDGMLHRTLGVKLTGDALVVRTRAAPRGSDRGLLATYTWSATDDGALALTLAVTPSPLRVALPALEGVEWFGRRDGRVGRFTELPGRDVRWLKLGGRLRIEAVTPIEITHDLRIVTPARPLVLRFRPL